MRTIRKQRLDACNNRKRPRSPQAHSRANGRRLLRTEHHQCNAAEKRQNSGKHDKTNDVEQIVQAVSLASIIIQNARYIGRACAN